MAHFNFITFHHPYFTIYQPMGSAPCLPLFRGAMWYEYPSFLQSPHTFWAKEWNSEAQIAWCFPYQSQNQTPECTRHQSGYRQQPETRSFQMRAPLKSSGIDVMLIQDNWRKPRFGFRKTLGNVIFVTLAFTACCGQQLLGTDTLNCNIDSDHGLPLSTVISGNRFTSKWTSWVLV